MFYTLKFILNVMIDKLRLLIILAFEHCHYQAVITQIQLTCTGVKSVCGSIAVGFGIKHSSVLG